MHLIKWLLGEAWEKVNVLEKWRELKALGKKHGRRFFIVAFLWELVEDVIFPSLAYHFGHPALIPMFLVMHFEPVVYPVFFWCFRMWDRLQGREPWDPDRQAASTYYRALTKTFTYRVISVWVFLLVALDVGKLDLTILSAYTVTMAIFGFVHDRIWHDSNFGIDVPTDTVRPIRVIWKVLSYRVVSILVMWGLYTALGYPMAALIIYQSVMLFVHMMHEGWWAQNPWGLRPVVHG